MLVVVRNPIGMRRQGRGYAPDTATLVRAWLRQFPHRDWRRMREWAEYHGLQASTTHSGFVVETMSAPDANAQRDGSSRILPLVRRPCMSSCAWRTSDIG
jgi:hypothetical protein